MHTIVNPPIHLCPPTFYWIESMTLTYVPKKPIFH